MFLATIMGKMWSPREPRECKPREAFEIKVKAKSFGFGITAHLSGIHSLSKDSVLIVFKILFLEE